MKYKMIASLLLSQSVHSLFSFSEKEMLLTPSIKTPLISPNLNIIENYLQTVNTCQQASSTLINSLMIGTYPIHDCNKICNAILAAQSIDPAISNYINIALNHIPGFQIKLSHQNERPINLEGQYLTNIKVMTLPVDIPKAELIVLIIHEFRHAVMAATQIARSNDKYSADAECYFPNDAKEAKKIKKYLQLGNDRMRALEFLLKKEYYQKELLSEKETDYLKELRELTQTLFDDYYSINAKPMQYDLTFDSAKQAKKHAKSLKVSAIIHSEYGDLAIINYKINDNVIETTCHFKDPLHAAVRLVAGIPGMVAANYPLEDEILEQEAYLYEYIPIPLIKTFYSELFDYSNQLLTTTLYHHSPYSERGVRNFYLKDFADIDLETTLSIPLSGIINGQRAEEMLNAALYGIQENKHVSQCETTLKNLITKGFFVDKANLLLGSCAYQRQDFKAAEIYFERAKRKGAAFTIDILFQAVKSFFENKNYKKAEHYCRQALKLDDQLQHYKIQFETILNAIKDQYQKNNQLSV